jgi:hypothetical protein
MKRQRVHHSTAADPTELARAAARLVAEGLDDYRAARFKAVDTLDWPRGAAMPSHDDIDRALMEHQALFGSKQRLAALAAARRTALRFMDATKAFSPRIFGPVLTGTANEHSRIRIELAIDASDAKDWDIFLLNTGWHFVLGDSQQRERLIYDIDFEDCIVEATLAGEHHRRSAKTWEDYLSREAFAARIEQNGTQQLI